VSYYDKDPNFTSVVGADPNDYWIDTGYETKVVNPAHVTMADYFINELRDAILAYNPNFPPDRALGIGKNKRYSKRSWLSIANDICQRRDEIVKDMPKYYSETFHDFHK